MSEGASDAPAGEGRQGQPPFAQPSGTPSKPASREARLTVVFFIAIAVLVLGLAGYLLHASGLVGRTLAVYRFSLTLAVESPSGVRMASSVYSLVAGEMFDLNGGGRRTTVDVSGDAVFLDLGQGGNLVMLLPGPNILAPLADARRARGEPAAKHGELTGSAEVKPPFLPTLITFRDLADPASAEVIRPDELHRIVAGGRLKSVTIEILPSGVWPLNLLPIAGPPDLFGTPVTRGIEKRLPWWGKPLPWVKIVSPTLGIDTRPLNEFRWGPDDLRRN